MRRTLYSTYAPLLFAGILAVTSCAKSIDASGEQAGKDEIVPVKTFTASIEREDESKTTLGKNNFVNWITGDQISINGAIYEATRDESDYTHAFFEYVSGTMSADAPYNAYYPVSLYNNGTPTLPSEYQYNAENPFKEYPMYAVSSNTSLKFKNICGLLRIVVPTGKTIKKVIVSSDHNLSGPFSIGEDGKTITMGEGDNNYVTLDCGAGAAAGSVLYIAIPPYDYTNLCARIQFAGNDPEEVRMVTRNVERNKMYTITVQNPGSVPSDALLPCEFSVSATKKVRFSKGNLQADIDATGKATAWKFATNQYDIIGNAVANTSIGEAAGTMDLFCWATDCGSRPWGINTQEGWDAEQKKWLHYQNNFIDWGSNMDLMKALGPGWRTLTGGPDGEWIYLFEKRTNASKLRKINVTVCGQVGCVIAPDGYSGGAIAASYDAASWATAQAAGMVFLPLAGNRVVSVVDNINSLGLYWSSTPNNESSAYTNYITTTWYSAKSSNERCHGRLVRLVQEVK